MVGAGSLIKPLLNLSDLTLAGITIPSHSIGVVIVGGVVITIVVTAGMVSTTWVQFIKGSLLVVFCAVLVVAILARGITETKVGDEWVVLADEKAKETAQAGGPALETRDSGALGPAEFLQKYSDSTIVSTKTGTAEGNSLLLPGSYFKGIRSDRLADRLDFASLMLALFCGTAALPHILIRYYTVKDSAAARKSTVVGIISIGFFYILTLYVGLGATVSGNLDPLDSNMSAPLLAKTFGELPFAFISAIAFTTVLGTVSGLILAASGAVAHDLIEIVGGHRLNEHAKVGAAKWAALGIGIVAIVLGILFRTFNASFLVGWAFNIAASANLPALVMLLFWKRTTAKGIAAAVVVGMVSSLAWILLSQQAFRDVFGVDPSLSPIPFSQPALVTVPLGFITLIIVSLLTKQQDYTSAPPRPFEVIQK
jgi:cation/acetate symporter